MQIKTKKNKKAIVFEVHGEVVATAARVLFKDISPYVKSDLETIIVDMRNVPYVDSLGLGTLIDLHQLLRDAGKKLQLCGPGEMIKQLFWDSSLDEIFDVVDTDALPEDLKM